MSNTSLDYINQYLESLKIQLTQILEDCNDLFVSVGLTQADTLTDVPTRISELISQNQGGS